MNIREILKKGICTGCAACPSACKHNALTIEKGKFGFSVQR